MFPYRYESKTGGWHLASKTRHTVFKEGIDKLFLCYSKCTNKTEDYVEKLIYVSE